MKIRTSLQVALIVGACTVLAPVYGPVIRANAATPQDDLDKNVKALANVFSILEDNYADKISSERRSTGCDPGHAAHARPALNFLDPSEYQDMQRKRRGSTSGSAC